MHSGKHQKFLRKELDSNQACRDFRHIASNGNPPFTYRRIAGPAPFIEDYGLTSTDKAAPNLA